MDVTPKKTGDITISDTSYSIEVTQNGILNLDIDPLQANASAFYVLQLISDGSEIILDDNFDSCNLITNSGSLFLTPGKYLLVVAYKNDSASLIVNEIFDVEGIAPPPPPPQNESMYKIGFNKVIKTQSEFNALTIEENDNILLDGDFTGSLVIDKKNVSICGGSIRSSEDLSPYIWTNEGNGVYSTPMASDPKWININGKNAKLSETQWNNITAVQGTNQLIINEADVTGLNIIGSYIVLQRSLWAYSGRYLITDYALGVITLDRDLEGNISAGDPYKLFNSDQFFSGDNQWAWRNGELKLKTTVSPSSLNLTMSSHDFGINIIEDNCKVKGVEIKESFITGIKTVSNNTVVDSCRIHDIRGQGIKAPKQVDYPNFSNNTIYDIGNNGIWCGCVQNSVNSNNLIYNIGVGENIGWNIEIGITGKSQTDGTGIKFNIDLDDPTQDANNLDVSENIVYNTAYNGISLHIGNTGIIEKNVVSNTNRILTDGGGIYCFHYRDTNIPFSGFVIQDNFIDPNAEGLVIGIYLDNRCTGNDILRNCIFDSLGDGGILINADTELNNISDNVSCSSSQRALWFLDWAAPDKIYANDKNLVNNNVLIGAKPLEFTSGLNPYVNSGMADNNKYITNDSFVLFNGANKTLAQLQTDYGTDINSVSFINNDVVVITNPSDFTLTGLADTGVWRDLDGNIVTNYSVLPWGNLVLLKD